MTGSPRSGEGQATGLVVVAAFAFALISIFTIVATGDGMPLAMFLLVRFGSATIALTPFAWWDLPAPEARGAQWRVLIAGAIGQSVVGALSLAALRWVPAATLVVLFYTFPAWVTLFAAWRGTEPLTSRRVTALLLSLAGVVSLVGWPGEAGIHPTGALLALCGALAQAIYVPVISRAQVGVPPVRATWLIALGVTVVFSIAAPLRSEFVSSLPWPAWATAIATGLISTGLGTLCFLRGLATLGPVRTSIFSTVEPIFAAILAAMFLAQPITRPMVVGGALIVAAVLLLSGNPDRRPR